MAALEDARWLVAGLGNPGPDYARTRHNVGFDVVERLAAGTGVRFSSGPYESQAALIRVSAVPVLLVKPQTFMNRSGASVIGWLTKLGLPASRLIVVHDDLDLALGQLRVVEAAGAAGHRGVRSIQESLGTTEFARVRVGIGRPESGENAADRVLADFTPAESSVLADAVDRGADAVRSVVLEGAARAMNRYNAWPTSDSIPAA